MQNQRKLVYLAFMILAAIAVALGVWLRSAKALPAPVAQSKYRILYFAPEQNALQASEDIPGSSQALQAEGFQIVTDYPSLKSQVEQQRPDAIVLHKKQLGQIDPKWVAAQYRKGVIVAGINMTMREIAAWVEDPSIMDANWTDSWYKMPFYSYAGMKESTDPFALQEAAKTGLSAAAKTGGTNNFEGTIKPFVSVLHLSIKDLQQQ